MKFNHVNNQNYFHFHIEYLTFLHIMLSIMTDTQIMLI